MSLPLLEYVPTTQNSRVPGYEVPNDDQPAERNAQTMRDLADMDQIIESAYRQMFFYAFAWDREPFLESQLRNGQITVRDFIRGLLLSKTFYNSFYIKNSNYRFVEQVVQRVLGRDVYNEREKIAWSIVVATKGIQGFADEILNSAEYLENFGLDTVPYQRRRVLPTRDSGELPFNIKSPRYNEYYRSILGFPQIVRRVVKRRIRPQEGTVVAGDPLNYLNMVRGINPKEVLPQRVSPFNISLDSVPYRQVNTQSFTIKSSIR